MYVYRKTVNTKETQKQFTIATSKQTEKNSLSVSRERKKTYTEPKNALWKATKLHFTRTLQVISVLFFRRIEYIN